MKIVIGSDHRGVDAKRRLVASLHGLGHDVVDLGTSGSESCDYPDFAYQVAIRVSRGEADRGILICGTSIGMCIAANKVRGVRAEMSRRHNDANVLCLSADLLGEELMERMARIFLETPFEGGRHARRVEKIKQIEQEQLGANGEHTTGAGLSGEAASPN
jgi:ribose 5-phosphate isomerase B